LARQIEVGRLAVGDLDAVTRSPSVLPDLATMLARQSAMNPVLVARYYPSAQPNEHEIVGVIELRDQIDELQIHLLEVFERQLGIGVRLVKEAVRVARERGRERLIVWSLPETMAFYRRLGFEESGEVVDGLRRLFLDVRLFELKVVRQVQAGGKPSRAGHSLRPGVPRAP
jgi:GNAT superfamily N-acetyltransferase